MLTWLLNTIYLSLVAVAFPFLAWAAFIKGKYREGFAEKFQGRVPARPKHSPLHLWLHAVSVGEVNLLAPLINELKSHYPGVTFHLTTTTKAGHDLAISKYAEHTVSYAPLDFSWAVDAAYRQIRPDAVLLVELELWPNLIRFAKKHQAKIVVVNGRLSEKSHRGYRRLRWLVGGLLQRLDLIAAQDESYAARFRDLGAPAQRVMVTGSMKFDGINPRRDNRQTQTFRNLAGFRPGELVWLAGSTQQGEEPIILEAFARAQAQVPQLRLVLVPRHPHRFDEVAELLQSKEVDYRRRSELGESLAVSPSVLLVDTVGELSAWWGTAHIAFVGGSLGNRGGQNMIEPAAYGAAVCFGPNTWNFKDVVERLKAADAAVVVHDSATLAEFVLRAAQDAPWRESLGQRARDAVLTQQGATQRTVDALEAVLPTNLAMVRQVA